MKTRTTSQNSALHVWFRLKSDQCRDAGVTAQMAFSKTIELEMSPELMKEIFRIVMKALYRKSSTKELSKHLEPDEVVEHLNRFFAEQFNLEGIPFPHLTDTLPNHGVYIEPDPDKTVVE